MRAPEASASSTTAAAAAAAAGTAALDVGLLWVCWKPLKTADAVEHNRHKHRPSDHMDMAPDDVSTPRYLQSIVDGSRAARMVSPTLPMALATNVRALPPSLLPDMLVVNMTLRPGDSAWIHRLRAFAASPFTLTLAVDDSVTICADLEPMLRQEFRLNRLDVAVNYEATPIPPVAAAVATDTAATPRQTHALLTRARRASTSIADANATAFAALATAATGAVLPFERAAVSRVPHGPHELTPHCFALLLRSGTGLTRVLSRWEAMLRHVDSFDQSALRRVFASLSHANWVDVPDAAAARRGAPSVRVRLMKLTESIAGFKSLDKRRGWYWPRYLRPVRGNVLLLHSFVAPPPSPLGAAGGAVAGGVRASRVTRASVCAALNAHAPSPRLIVQVSPRHPIESHTTIDGCVEAIRRRTADNAERGIAAADATRLCWLLASAAPGPTPQRPTAGVEAAARAGALSAAHEPPHEPPTAATTTTALVEPVAAFWRWATVHGLAARRTHQPSRTWLGAALRKAATTMASWQRPLPSV